MTMKPKKIDLFEIYTKLLNIFENCIHKNDILKVRIMCQEIARIQDFAPFTPELLGALRDPGRKGQLASRGGRLASQNFLRYLTRLVFQNLTALSHVGLDISKTGSCGSFCIKSFF